MDWEEVTLSDGNVRQGHFYLPNGTTLFPTDSWGGNNKSKMGTQVSVTFSGTGETVKTDIDGEKRLLREARGQSKRFIEHHDLRPGDKIFIHKTKEREFLVATNPAANNSFESLTQEFERQIQKALNTSAKERKQKLQQAPTRPEKTTVTTTVFMRNPYVVAEVLLRANGICERCNTNAPFHRKSDGSPYLEVHHKTPLADDGEDTVANAIALCPNCHRELHLGKIA